MVGSEKRWPGARTPGLPQIFNLWIGWLKRPLFLPCACLFVNQEGARYMEVEHFGTCLQCGEVITFEVDEHFMECPSCHAFHGRTDANPTVVEFNSQAHWGHGKVYRHQLKLLESADSGRY